MKRSFFCSITSLILVFAMLVSTSGYTFAAEEASEAGPETPGADSGVTLLDDNFFQNEMRISVPFSIFKDHLYSYDFPYTDDYFREPSSAFSRQLAQASLGLEFSAFRNNSVENLENQYGTYLTGAGFSDIHSFGYTDITSPETLSGVIAQKTIDDFTLIACAPAGQGYEKEWGGNLTAGTGERHEGFQTGAQILEGELLAYLEEHQITGKVKLWIAGFSRGSAVANLTAADMMESGRFTDVYAYLFGVPRTTRAPAAYPGIYNICGTYDPVTTLPPESWDYGRYGTDLYTPAQETRSDYTALKERASVIYENISGSPLRNNPVINHQLHLVGELLSEMFPEPEEFVRKMQGELVRIWTEPDEDHLFTVLAAVMSNLDDLDQRQQYSSQVFIDYLSYVASAYLKGNEQQIEAGYWDEEAEMAENYLREHSPLTYLAWVFSDSPSETVFSGSRASCMLVIESNLDLAVYEGGTLLASVDRDGRITKADGNGPGGPGTDISRSLPDPSIIRQGDAATIHIPLDGNFRVVLHSEERQRVFYNTVVYSPSCIASLDRNTGYSFLGKGDYMFFVTDDGRLSGLCDLQGNPVKSIVSRYEASSTVMMAAESSYEEHLTPLIFLGNAVLLVLFLVLLALACLIIAIVHRIRRKKRGRPYSDWWVIVPHLILIVIFAALTRYLAKNLTVISISVDISAGATILWIALLSLRAAVRNRNRGNTAVTLGLFSVAALTYLFSSIIWFRHYHSLRMALFLLLAAALTALAVFGFYRGKTKTPAHRL